MIKINYKKGFTLLEALVAISILMVAVAAPITIAQKGLSSATYSKNQMIASYLAQDVIEYIKNKRDEVSINNLNYGDWDNLSIFGLNGNPKTLCMSANGCEVDTLLNVMTDTNAVKQIGSQLTPLNTDTNGFYGYKNDSGYKATNFTRKINIELHNIDGGATSAKDEALITVTVSWGSDSVVVKSLIYNI